MDKFFGNWLDDSVIREDENGNRYIKRFTPGKVPVEVAVSADCKAAFGGQGYGEVHELREISKEEYETYGIKWGWGADPWKTLKVKGMKKHKDEYEKEYKDVETLVTMGVNVGWIPLEERDIIITLVQEYLSAEIWMDPAGIKKTEDGDFIPCLSLKFLKGILNRNEQQKKKMCLELRGSEEYTKNEDTQEARELPRELNTPKAKEILQRVVDAGYLDKYFRPKEGVKKVELSFLARCISLELWGHPQWVVFEKLWDTYNLRRYGAYDLRQAVKINIENLFSEKVIKTVNQ